MRKVTAGRLWAGWLAFGLSCVAAYLVLPTGSLAAEATYAVLGLAAAAAIVVGVRAHRPARPLPWYLFAAGQAVWAFGDVAYSYYGVVLGVDPYPSVADGFYLCAYPLFTVGFVVLVRSRAGRDVAGLLDALIVATGLGLVLWEFVLRPIAADTGVSGPERAIGLAYPVGDLLLLAMLARLFTARCRRTASFCLLALAGVLLLGADVAFSVVTLYAPWDGGLVDLGWLLSYVTWAAAALHPSMRALAVEGPGEGVLRAGRPRLVALGASTLVAPLLLFQQGINGAHDIDWLAIGTAAVVLFLLVVARMTGLVMQVHRQAARLRDLALHDDPTGLPNRRQLEERLRDLAAAPAQVVLIGIDNLSLVNDRLGRAVGDTLTASVARRLAHVARPGDLLARLGDDEFAILMPDSSAGAADQTAAGVRALLRRPVQAGPGELLVAVSVGVADSTGTDDPLEPLRRADVALSLARKAGGRVRRYEPAMDRRADENARLAAQLPAALHDGQFHLVYQPIVALPDGGLTGVEALVRWRHPDRGVIGPAEFIPVAESNGFIVDLGAWILRTACAQAAAWLAADASTAPGRMSVNVSARQLADPGFVDVVRAALADAGLAPERLVIELTETAIFEVDQSLETLLAIRRLGVRVALDDFGTGYSSLGLLQTVPVDILKVDKSFVDDINLPGRDRVIASALIRVADGLGIVAVAEGVETAAQARELHRLGYLYAQGYHFGRPAPPLAIEPAAADAVRADAPPADVVTAATAA